jgi:hypothetical protein
VGVTEICLFVCECVCVCVMIIYEVFCVLIHVLKNPLACGFSSSSSSLV